MNESTWRSDQGASIIFTRVMRFGSLSVKCDKTTLGILKSL